MSTPTTTAKIPVAYRTVFVLLDIAMPLMGLTFNLFQPHTALSNLSAGHNSSAPIPPSTLVLLHSDAGFFAALCFLNIFLLAYRPHDVLVWKGLATAVMLQDVFMVGGFLREIRGREGMGPGVDGWTGGDWGNVVGYAGIALVRLLFVVGVGMGGGSRGSVDNDKAKKEL